MKYLSTKLTLFFLFIFSCFYQIYSEGFAAGTLVKTFDGYVKIEDVRIGDYVVCYDSNKKSVGSKIICINKKCVERYMRITVAGEYLSLACGQRLYKEDDDIWIDVVTLKSNDLLSGHEIRVELVQESIDVYLIAVAMHHNFFVTKADFCVHNFFPPIVLAISAAFGFGSVELASISAGFAGLGAFLGYQWHKNSKNKNAFVIQSQFHEQGTHLADDAQAPGLPTEKDGFYPPKKWDGKKKTHPVNGTVGWPDKKGKIWVPTGVGPKAHGGPHWDVQYPNGIDYDNVYPGGKIRSGR